MPAAIVKTVQSQGAATVKTARDFAVPLAVLGIVLALISPMPSVLLDVLLATDIMLSLIVLMVALYIRRPVEFSIFPTILLLLTLFRLALNISSTRLILMQGNTGTGAAGEVIDAFGSFLVGGNYIIGTVIFLVLIAIQYVVINHGAVRISEVTARFTLDALPGKQMSIDSDLNTGLIDEAEARVRRKELAAEAEFYGAMDGASRFTQRDAIASILITGINIIAGFLVGVFQHGMPLSKAIQTYTVLTIGDGLVTVIPALMISISGGLIVTRASSEERLGEDVQRQLFGKQQPILLSAGVLLVLALFPAIPALPFLALGGVLASFGLRKGSREVLQLPPPQIKPVSALENVEELLRVDPMSLELGLGLVKFVAGNQESPLMKRLSSVRRQLASDLGFVLGPVRIADNVNLRANEYRILIRGLPVDRFELPSGCELAIPVGRMGVPEGGTQTKEPTFGMPAWWVPSDKVEKARREGYTMVDPVTVLGAHLAEIVKRHSYELLSRQDMKKILDRVAVENPKTVEELVPKLMSLAGVHKVFQNLLRERVSIKDAVPILDALSEAAVSTKNVVLLTEYVRGAVRRSVVRPYLAPSGDLTAFLLSPDLERIVEQGVHHGEMNSHINSAPAVIRDVLTRIGRKVSNTGTQIPVIVTSGARYFFRQLSEAEFPYLAFLGANEIPPEVKITALGVID